MSSDKKSVDNFKHSLLSVFPKDILIYIMGLLSTNSFQNLVQTCKFLAPFSDNDTIWYKIAKYYVSDLLPFKPVNKSYKWLCLAKQYSYLQKPKHGICGNYIVTKNGSIPNGTAIVIADREVYSGEFQNGKAHGQCVCYYQNGNRYDGNWVDGVQSGHGEFIWYDGDFYEGEWDQNTRHGKGRYVWSTGAEYIGEFQRNELEGEGIYKWERGVYKGTFVKSHRHGKGEVRWDNGNCYRGEFKNNQRDGQGEYHWSEGSAYIGSWVENKREGFGVSIWPNGVRYSGEYQNDMRNGDGILSWANGDRYVGTWKNGGRKGYGKFYPVGSDTSIEQWWNEEESIKYSETIPLKQN